MKSYNLLLTKGEICCISVQKVSMIINTPRQVTIVWTIISEVEISLKFRSFWQADSLAMSSSFTETPSISRTDVFYVTYKHTNIFKNRRILCDLSSGVI